MNITRSNHEWVSLVSDGDYDAINDLFDSLYRYVLHIVRDLSFDHTFDLHQFAQDIAQDTILIARNRIEDYEYRAKFTSWCYSIAKFRAYGKLRRQDISMDSTWNKTKEYASLVNAYSSWINEAIDDAIDTEPLIARLYDIIENALSERQRFVITCGLKGFTDDEIAYRLDTNRNNVYKIKHDAIVLIRKLIGQQ